MNSVIVVCGVIASSPGLRYVGDKQTPLCELLLDIPPIKEGEKGMLVKVLAWGKYAQTVADTWKKSDPVVVEGVAEINKVDRPEGFKEDKLQISAKKIDKADPEATTNTIVLIGRLGRDPEMKYFESGSVVAKATLAVDKGRKNDSEPYWFATETWGKTAETVANYVRKGSLIGVSGQLKFDHWNDRSSGAKRSRPVVRVDQMRMLGSKSDNAAPASNDYDDDPF